MAVLGLDGAGAAVPLELVGLEVGDPVLLHAGPRVDVGLAAATPWRYAAPRPHTTSPGVGRRSPSGASGTSWLAGSGGAGSWRKNDA